MDREKINKQASLLRSKKLAKSAAPIAPKVQNGVVKVDVSIPKNTPKAYNTPKPPTHLVKKTTDSEKKVQRQTLKPQNITNRRPVRAKGCTGCRRRIRRNG